MLTRQEIREQRTLLFMKSPVRHTDLFNLLFDVLESMAPDRDLMFICPDCGHRRELIYPEGDMVRCDECMRWYLRWSDKWRRHDMSNCDQKEPEPSAPQATPELAALTRDLKMKNPPQCPECGNELYLECPRCEKSFSYFSDNTVENGAELGIPTGEVIEMPHSFYSKDGHEKIIDWFEKRGYIVRKVYPDEEKELPPCGHCGKPISEHPKEEDGGVSKFGVDCPFEKRRPEPIPTKTLGKVPGTKGM